MLKFFKDAFSTKVHIFFKLPKLTTLLSDEKYLHQVGVEAFEEFSYQPPCLVFFMGNEKLGEGKGKKKLWQQEILDY